MFTKGILAILVDTVYKLFINCLRKVFTKENLAILDNKVYEFINKFINSVGSQSFRKIKTRLHVPRHHTSTVQGARMSPPTRLAVSYNPGPLPGYVRGPRRLPRRGNHGTREREPVPRGRAS